MMARMLRAVGVKIFSVDMIVGMIVAFAFVYSWFIYINCAYDSSDAELYHAKVLDKYISGHWRNGYSHNLEIGNWGTITGSRQVGISEEFYDHVTVGSQIAVYTKKGTLGIPWFYIEK